MNTHDNLSDLLTKVITMSEKQRVFVGMIQHHVFVSFLEITVVA